MHFTRDVRAFARLNQGEMIRMLRAHLQTDNMDVIMDRLQDWYLAILQNKSLEKFDPSKGASFETFLFNVACWGSKNRQRQKRDTVQIGDDMVDSRERAESDLDSRISDYREYLHAHGGDRVGDLLGVLEQRIKGDVCEDGKGAAIYRRHLRDYLAI